MKIVTVVGARPQFVKAAAVSRVIRKEVREVIVHTGQHYDKNMSDLFFEELDIPKPDYNLGVGSKSHGQQTAAMLVGIEEVLLKEKPDYLLVYGDTNSTLAGALAAVKLHIPIIHVEAGLRSYNNAMPEEINRVITDRISTYLFCPTDTAVQNLEKEGITAGVYDVGDVMCDAVLYYAANIKGDIAEHIGKLQRLFNARAQISERYYLATIHRAENTDSKEKIQKLLAAFEGLDAPVIFPVHPRTQKLVGDICAEREYGNILFCEPVGYLDMLFLLKHAAKAVTDSGGLQKEAYILGTPCVTVRSETEWVETLTDGWNVLAKTETEDIVKKVNLAPPLSERKSFYGDGKSAEKILSILTTNN